MSGKTRCLKWGRGHRKKNKIEKRGKAVGECVREHRSENLLGRCAEQRRSMGHKKWGQSTEEQNAF